MILRNDIFNTFAKDYESVVQSNFNYFSEYLENYPSLIFDVSDSCFEYLMKNFEKQIRKGIQNNSNVCFSITKEKLERFYKVFENELKGHFENCPGLWFYIFRYDQKRKGDNNLKIVNDIKTFWGIND